MTSYLAIVADELRVISQRSYATVVLVGCGLVALAICLTPTLVDGNSETVGLAGLVYGFRDGALLACVVGPLASFVVAQTDFDSGMRAVRHLGGLRYDWLSAAQLGSSIAVAIAATATTALAAMLAGAADVTRRSLIGPNADVLAWTTGPLVEGLVILGGSIAATVVCWMLCVAWRSGARAIGFAAVSVATWVGLLFAVADRGLRPWLVVHPVAYPWKLVDPVDAASATVEAPILAYAASVAGWGAVLVIVALRRLRRP